MAKVKKQKLSRKGSVVTVEYPTIKKSVTLDVAKVPAEMRELLLYHGAGQKLGDAASGGTPLEKFEMASRIVAGLYAGEWELKGTPDTSGIILEAVSRIKKIPLVKLQKAAEAKPELVKDWGANVTVKAEVAKIRAERAEALADEADDEEELVIEIE
jgi:hypothetical protein